MDSFISDLVLDSLIEVKFDHHYTHRLTMHNDLSSSRFGRRRPRKDVWEEVKKLGKGAYGTVSLQRCLTSDKAELQAVKKIKKTILPKRIDYFKELEAIAKFSQKKYEGLFVEFIGWYENVEHVFIVMEYIENGDLDSHLERPLPESEARLITFQLAEGLSLLHENGFVHRDLKPANIFVFRKGPKWWVKIGDFGFSKRDNGKEGMLRSLVGTPAFLAPEVRNVYLTGMNNKDTMNSYTNKVDIWALGIITFYMVFLDHPFDPEDISVQQQYMQDGNFPFPKPRSKIISSDCKSFIKAAMARHASERLSAKEAMETAWLRQGEFHLTRTLSMQIKEEKLRCSEIEEFHETLLPVQERPSLLPVQERPSLLPLPLQKESSPLSDSDNHNLSPATNKNVQAYVLPYRGLSTRKESTAVKSESSETQTVSSSYEGTKQLELRKWLNLHKKGVESFQNHEFKTAEFYLRRAAEGREKLLTLDDRDTRTSYDLLGITYYYMSRYSEAKRVFQKLFEYRSEAHGSNCVSTLRSRYRVGAMTIREGNYPEGLSILQQVVETQKCVLGVFHPHTSSTLHEIEEINAQIDKATSSMQQMIWDRAPLLQRSSRQFRLFPRTAAVKIRGLIQNRAANVRVLLPHNSPKLLPKPKQGGSTKIETHYRTMAELGQRLHGQGDYNTANNYLEVATEGLQKCLGPTHADSLDALYWLGRNQFELFHYEAAEHLFSEVADGFSKSLGSTSRKTLDSLYALGLALSKQRKYSEAEKVFRSALRELEHKSDKYDQCLVHTSFQIGFTLYKQGNSGEAEPILEETLTRQRLLLGPGAEETIECAFWLGCVLFDLEKYSDSEEAFWHAYRRTFTTGKGTRSMTTSHWLGLSMYYQKKYKKAMIFLNQAYSRRYSKYGEYDLDTLCSTYWLGLAYYRQARYADAEPLLFQAQNGIKTRFGPSNQDTLDCLYWYEKVLQAQKKAEMAELAQQELIQGYMVFFSLEYPASLLTIQWWIESLQPQEKFFGANLDWKEVGPEKDLFQFGN
ncbi:hypothetical protein N7462_010564 [Penicillium macrosclerotiorum]|uniref:uncharacterized protein n=1 Tax=Penicillium macrosclerotiorum TaxID=303699 RepID=UPI0025475E59|nr:uncharacterized protein N7462_010564 [Penicillium macrosclerotiorum]KAJ5669494.1 hypothetical protein N7462_010564 [Penicillium macrosclerotiorum]